MAGPDFTSYGEAGSGRLGVAARSYNQPPQGSVMRLTDTRFTVQWMMCLTLFLAVGIASLLNASAGWVMVVRSLSASLLLIAILGTIYRTGRRRAFWVGFLTFGWGYVILSVIADQSKDTLVSPSRESRKALNLLNLKKPLILVTGSYSDVKDFQNGMVFKTVKVLDSYAPNYFYVLDANGRREGRHITDFRADNSEYYLNVGDSLFNLMYAFIGSSIALGFYRPLTDTDQNAESLSTDL